MPDTTALVRPHPIAAAAVLLVAMTYATAVIYSQFFLNGPLGINPQGDFTAHSGFTDAHYSFTFILRDLISALFGTSNYTSLFFLLATAVCLNVLVPFLLLATTGRSLLTVALFVGIYCSFMPVYNLVDDDVLYGQISPNNWHNSTFLIAILPNLAFFLFTMKAIRENLSAFNIVVLTLLAVLSMSAKPSYFSIFAPAVLLYALAFDRSRLPTVIALGFLPCVLFVLFYVYLLPSDLEVVFDPGGVWSVHSGNIPYSVFTSTIFFIALAVLYRQRYWAQADIRLALVCLLIGIVQFYLVAEVGFRREHANFSWAMHQALNVLLFVSLRFLLLQPMDQSWRIAVGAAGLHVLTGLAFCIDKYLWPLTKYPTVSIFQP